MVDMMTDPIERKRLAILTIFLLALSALFSWVVTPWLWSRLEIPPFYSRIIFNTICVLLFLFVPDCNPFTWSRMLVDEKKRRPRYKLHRNIAVGLSFLVVFLRAAGAYYFNHHVDDWKPEMNNIPYDTLAFLLGAFSEEILCKAGLLRILLELKVPRPLSLAVVCAIFALIHFNFIPLFFAVIFFLGILFLLVFSLYPSIVFVAFLHFACNIS